MIANRLTLGWCVSACFILIAMSGCKKLVPNQSNGEPTAPDVNEQTPRSENSDAEKTLERHKRVSHDNLSRIGAAMMQYDGGQRFPSPGIRKGMDGPRESYCPHSWRVAILPLLIYWKLADDLPLDIDRHVLPEDLSRSVVKVYVSPLAKEPTPLTHYRVFVGNGAAFDWDRGWREADFADGRANTILVVEAAEPIVWTSRDDFEYDPKKPLPKLGIFSGGFHALMGDGKVRWIPADTPEATIRAMITRSGGERIRLPDD